MNKINNNINSKEELFNLLSNFLSILSEEYKNKEVHRIIISHGIRKGITGNLPVPVAVKPVIVIPVLQKNYLIPSTFNVLKYGKLIHKTNNYYFIELESNLISIIETKYSRKEKLNIVKIMKNGIILLEYIDKKVNNNTFIRKLNLTIYK